MTFDAHEIAAILRQHVVRELKVPCDRIDLKPTFEVDRTRTDQGRVVAHFRVDTRGTGNPYRDPGAA